MSQKLALDTLLTALTCLLPDSGNAPINLYKHPAFNDDNDKLFCDVRKHLDEKFMKIEIAREENEKSLLMLQKNMLEFKTKNRTDCEVKTYPSDCTNKTFGVYEILPTFLKQPFYTVCDSSYGGNWTLLLQHYKDDDIIKPTLTQYINGFGNLNGNFNIGLRRIYSITNTSPQEVLLFFKDKHYKDYEMKFAYYDEFVINDRDRNYSLKTLGKCRGMACDILGKPEMWRIGKKGICRNTPPKDWWDFNCHESASIKLFVRPRKLNAPK